MIAKPSRSSASACSSAAATSSGVGRERRRHQQRLHRHARVERALQPLVDDALVRRVHVDEHDAGAVLREHVDAVELREREAQRMRVVGRRADRAGRLAARPRAGRRASRRTRRTRRRRARIAPCRGAAYDDAAAPAPPDALRARAAARAPTRARASPPPTPRAARRRSPRARARRACWTNWWTAPDSRKRTSLFCGCTLTSTCRGSSVEPQRVRRLAVVMQHVAIRFAQRVRQHAVAHEAAVDEHVLAATPASRTRAARRSPRSRAAATSASTVAAPSTNASPSSAATRARRPCASSRWIERGRCAAA